MTDQERQDYLYKRTAVLSALEGLVGYWEMAPGIIELIGSPFVTPEVLDGVSDMLRDAMKNAQGKEARERMQRSLDILNEFREREKKEREELLDTGDTLLLELQLT